LENAKHFDYAKVCFVGHNFPTTNPKWPIKGSKDADFRLDYFKREKTSKLQLNFSQVPMAPL